MERKVKLKLPKKYSVGVKALVHSNDKSFIDIVKTVIDAMKNGVHMDRDSEFEFASTGMTMVTNPLIRSIAETKMMGLNNVFRHYCVPMEAFLKEEEQK